MLNGMRYLVLAALVAPVSVFAVGTNDGLTCANAKDIFSNSTVMGDTCAAGDPIGTFGILPSTGMNDFIYTFVANNANATVTVPVVQTGYNYGIFLTAACNGDSGFPLFSATGPTAGGTFTVSGLSNTVRYYIIMSGNPAAAPPQCGTYTVGVAQTLPVSLQDFSVE